MVGPNFLKIFLAGRLKGQFLLSLALEVVETPNFDQIYPYKNSLVVGPKFLKIVLAGRLKGQFLLSLVLEVVETPNFDKIYPFKNSYYLCNNNKIYTKVSFSNLSGT